MSFDAFAQRLPATGAGAHRQQPGFRVERRHPFRRGQAHLDQGLGDQVVLAAEAILGERMVRGEQEYPLRLEVPRDPPEQPLFIGIQPVQHGGHADQLEAFRQRRQVEQVALQQTRLDASPAQLRARLLQA